MTLNDLERRNSPNLWEISPNSVAFGTEYVKVVGDTPKLSAAEMLAKESSFSDLSLTAILAGITPSESVKVTHSPLASENETITWKRCKIGGNLLLISNRKSYMSFRLVPKSGPWMTLNGVMAVALRYFTEFGSFLDALRKGGSILYIDTFCGRIFIAIFAKVTENEFVMHRRSHVTGCNHCNITYSLLFSNSILQLLQV